jgi:hypothetical protein
MLERAGGRLAGPGEPPEKAGGELAGPGERLAGYFS